MKIAFLRYPKQLYEQGKVLLGGSEIANQLIINYLRKTGNQVIEFSPQSPERLDLIDIPAIGTPLMFQDLLCQIKQINSCDVFVASSWFGAILPEVTIPRVIIYHSDARLILEQNQPGIIDDKKLLKTWLARAQKYGLGGQCSQNEHEAVIALGEEFQAKTTDKIIAVSELVKGSLIRHYPLTMRKITTIGNPFPSDWLNNKPREFGLSLNLATVTRIPADEVSFRNKGIDRLFEIYSQLPEFKKTIVASTKPNTVRLFGKKYLKNTKFIENASRLGVREALNQAAILVYPSRLESFGLPIIEAMALGTVPVVFPTGITGELIRSGQNGYLVNSVSEAVKIIKNLNRDRKLLEKLSRQAQIDVAKHFSIEKIGPKYQTVLASVIKSKITQK